MSKELLFSLTKDDFKFDYFCTGGNGGQHKNAKRNGVRCTHPPSGAVAEHRDGRDQFLNKREAFRKCVESPVFKAWHRMECSRRMQGIDRNVDIMMNEVNLKIEYYDPNKEN